MYKDYGQFKSETKPYIIGEWISVETKLFFKRDLIVNKTIIVSLSDYMWSNFEFIVSLSLLL